VLRAIFEECKGEIRLSERVVSIDYSGKRICVVTQKEKYECDYLISSLPLGVLQQDRVKFQPDLPLNYSSKLKNMGFGVANKIYVSFDKPFWGENQGWILFVTKG